MNETWIVLGASSAMARAFARTVAARGDAVILCGRDMDDIRAQAADIRLRGARDSAAMPFDARAPDGFAAIVQAAESREGRINAAVFVGSMPPQGEIDIEPELIAGTVADSFTGPAQFLHMLAPLIESRGSGTVIGVASVAGDRGRLSNYVYGSAKAGFATYLSGLRNRLARAGGHVLTVKPGFVDTAMTWGLPGMFLVASPEDVAGAMLRAADKKRNVIYTPGFWRAIMTIIRLIPEPIFKKLKV